VKLQISVDNKLYEVEVEVPEETGPRYTNGYVPPYAPTSRVTVPTPPPAAAPTSGSALSNGNGASGNVCKSPMAGVVVKINAQLGQQIQENDLLMVLEAMKMETNITAPVSGKIKAINVNPGDAVTVDQVVVEFD
jgi:methylmalonyl-CoA carboxyltransferase small subunit